MTRRPGGDITVTAQYGEAADDQPQGVEQRITSSTTRRSRSSRPGLIASSLRIAEGTQVISRHQKRYVNDTPWSLQTTFYPMGFVLQGANKLIEAVDIQPGTVSYLADTLGLRQVAYRDWITVRAPNATETQFFNLPQDGRIGVFEIFRTAFDQTGTPMRLTVSVYPTDRNQFVLNVGTMPDSAYFRRLGLRYHEPQPGRHRHMKLVAPTVMAAVGLTPRPYPFLAGKRGAESRQAARVFLAPARCCRRAT